MNWNGTTIGCIEWWRRVHEKKTWILWCVLCACAFAIARNISQEFHFATNARCSAFRKYRRTLQWTTDNLNLGITMVLLVVAAVVVVVKLNEISHWILKWCVNLFIGDFNGHSFIVYVNVIRIYPTHISTFICFARSTCVISVFLCACMWTVRVTQPATDNKFMEKK